MKRRRFFQVSVLGALGLGAALVVGEHTFGRGSAKSLSDPLPLTVLSASESVTLRAVALRILDGAEPSPSLDGGAAVCQFVDRYLTHLPGGLQRDVRALLHLVELYPLLQLRMARFSHLRSDEQDALLAAWQDSRIGLLRQGFQALKSLACLAHYQDARSFAAIGYSGPLV
jgi:hypothetical protein